MAAGGRTKRLHVRAPRRRGAPRPAEGPHLGSVYRGAAWQNGWRGDGWRPRGPSQGPQRASRTARRHRSAPVARRRRAQTGDGAALQRRAREGDGGRRCDGIRALGRGRSVCGSASVRVQNARGGPFFRGPPLAVGMRWTWPYGNPRPERGRTVGHNWLPVVRLGLTTLIRPLGWRRWRHPVPQRHARPFPGIPSMGNGGLGRCRWVSRRGGTGGGGAGGPPGA